MGADDGLRKTAEEEAAKMHAASEEAKKWARIHQVVYFALGIAGIIAGAVAGFSILNKTAPEASVYAAFLAAILVGVQTALQSQKRSEMHWAHRRGFERLAMDYTVASRSPDPLTDAKLHELSRRYEEVEAS